MKAILTELIDQIAENLYPEQITSFIERFNEACVGKDTSDVWRQFAIWMLVDKDHGVIKFTKPGTHEHNVIQRVALLYIDNCKDIELWREAVKDAMKADWVADDNADKHAGMPVAIEAAYAAYNYFAAEHAAMAADHAASACYSAWVNNWTAHDDEYDDEYLVNNETANDDAAYKKMAEKLIELLKQAPEKTL